jgi:hypothetical protein
MVRAENSVFCAKVGADHKTAVGRGMGTAGGMKGSKRRWILRTKKIDSTAALCYTYME